MVKKLHADCSISGRCNAMDGVKSRGTILTKSGEFVCFADDTCIISRAFGTVAELHIRLKREAAKDDVSYC